MSSIKSVLSKTINIPLNQMGILLLVMVTAFVKSAGLVLLDVGTIDLYLRELGQSYLAVDFIWASVILMGAGYYALLFERRHGYGAIPLCAVFLLILTGIIYLTKLSSVGVMNVLFLLNIGAFVFFNGAFWSVATRFVSLNLQSRKFIGVLCSELAGFGVMGFILNLSTWNGVSVLALAIVALTFFLGLIWGLVSLNPVPSETFIHKSVGSQDTSGRKLEGYLFSYSFLSVFAKGLLFVALTDFLIERQTYIMDLGLIWGLFGLASLMMILLLYRLRYLHIVLGGVIAYGLSFMLGADAVLLSSFELMVISTVLSMVCGHFYVQHFLIMLPKPLATGYEKQIKFQRIVYVEPLGILCVGILFFYLSTQALLSVILMTSGMLLITLAVLLIKLYSGILKESFRRRQWREGPLMLSSDSLLQYMLKHLKSDDADEVIYFLRTLGISKHPDFYKQLIKLLKHQNETVRLFVLNRIERLYPIGAFTKTLEHMFLKDTSDEVRSNLLSLLMQGAYDKKGEKGLKPYMKYLTDKQIQSGVLVALLKIGGNQALIAMDTLQKLSFSKDEKENIKALKIIEQVPLAGLVRLVAPHMKHPNLEVATQALMTAGAMRHPELLSAVFEALDDLDLQETALVALEKYGKQAFPPLEKMLHSSTVPLTRQRLLISFLKQLPSGEGKQILLRAVTADNQKMRKSTMLALINSGIVWIHKSKKALLSAGLNKDLKRIHYELDFIENRTQSPTHETEEAFSFLRRAMQEDVNDTRELILLQLQLLKPHPLFVKAIRILLSDRTDQYDTALGVVQDFLPYRLYQKIKPIALLPIRAKKVPEDRVISENILAKQLGDLLLHPPFVLPVWIKATILYCLRKLGDEASKPAVLSALQDRNPIVLEAAIWALVRLEHDENRLHETLLQVPTSYLVGQSLEQILES
ncbi:MAG: HEAT repeat domain-containing protein [Alphaproteobacteria bacterium]|nr:HEAT repeat domain-containing protein [Alphaproteobacteria bacterium]